MDEHSHSRPVPVSSILSEAALACLTEIIVFGQTEEGDLYAASSSDVVADVHKLLARGNRSIASMERLDGVFMTPEGILTLSFGLRQDITVPVTIPGLAGSTG